MIPWLPWCDTTTTKLKQIIARVLVETEYLRQLQGRSFESSMATSCLENAIRSNGDTAILPAV